MGNIIIGTQSEYLCRCRLALHDVSEGAIPRFCKLGSGFDPASASITTCFCVTSPTHVLLHYGPKNNHYDGSKCRPLITTSPVDTPRLDCCVMADDSTPIGRFHSTTRRLSVDDVRDLER
eukprot:scaffold14131_cov89-Cyclotella_meneghiniana.AAC.2